MDTAYSSPYATIKKKPIFIFNNNKVKVTNVLPSTQALNLTQKYFNSFD